MTDELLALEQRIAARDRVAELLADDFVEVGASGRIYDRAAVLAAMPAAGYAIEDFAARALGDAHALVTFVARGERGGSRRSSIWARHDEGWRLAFHQGTPLTA